MNTDFALCIVGLMGAVFGFFLGFSVGEEKGFIDGASEIQRVNR